MVGLLESLAPARAYLIIPDMSEEGGGSQTLATCTLDQVAHGYQTLAVLLVGASSVLQCSLRIGL